jgi:hypothetical protein
MSRKYRVGVELTVYEEVDVEADSVEEAVEKGEKEACRNHTDVIRYSGEVI